jgi:ribosomal protein L11 methyltransferase
MDLEKKDRPLTITTSRMSVSLSLQSETLASLMEELLWTLEGIESITYHLDGEEHFRGLQVIGTHSDLSAQIEALCRSHNLLDQVIIGPFEEIREEDWAECWKKYWHVNRILPHLVIQPSWEAFEALPEDVVLRLDPGSAFGTGTHETTQLMLFLLNNLIAEQKLPVSSLLDVGTGSSILALYAAKLGVKDCLAIDNDAGAVAVAQENVRNNQAQSQVHCSTEPLEEVVSARTFDMVVANILASVLQTMMPTLVKALRLEGILLMSGITRRQLPDMNTAINENGLILTRILQKGDWLALVCKRKG